MRVIDGRVEIEQEFSRASPELREHVRVGLQGCLAERFFVEALPSYFSTRAEGASRARILMHRLHRMVGRDPH